MKIRKNIHKKQSQHRYQQAIYVANLPNVDDPSEVVSLGENILDSNDDSSSDSNFEKIDNLSLEDESMSADEHEIDSNQPNKVDYIDTLFTTLTSHVGLNLTSAEIVVNLFSDMMKRFSRDPIYLPNIRHHWNKNAKYSNLNVYILCEKGHHHGPFSGEPRSFGSYNCDGLERDTKIEAGKYFLHLPLKPQVERILSNLNDSCWNIDDRSDVSNSLQAKKVKTHESISNIKKPHSYMVTTNKKSPRTITEIAVYSILFLF